MIVNLTMGMLTPPVGGLLFVTWSSPAYPVARMIGELWPSFPGADKRPGSAAVGRVSGAQYRATPQAFGQPIAAGCSRVNR